MVPGVARAARKPLSDCRRRRSISSSLNAGLRTTSARIWSAGSNRADITLVLIDDWSQPAPEFSVPPSASIASAIWVADFVVVPRVNNEAVISATPDRSDGSTSPPLLIRSCAVTKGISVRGMTITRKPFAKFFSTGLGKTGECGAVGGGGVACGACAIDLIAPPANTKVTSKKVATFLWADLIYSPPFAGVLKPPPVLSLGRSDSGRYKKT